PFANALDSTVLTSDSVKVRCVPLVAAETVPVEKPPEAPPMPRETFDTSQARAPAKRRGVPPDSAFEPKLPIARISRSRLASKPFSVFWRFISDDRPALLTS